MESQSLMERLNTGWHRPVLVAFLAMVLAHLMEHAFQAVQIFLFGWARSESRGLAGEWFPWLVTSEWLHYIYAILTLAGLIVLLPGFVGRARLFWVVAIGTQFWHHFEHLLLLVQRLTEDPWFGERVPTSVVQLLVMRVELHLFYNAVVMVPIVIAAGYHFFPTDAERLQARCACAVRRLSALATGAAG